MDHVSKFIGIWKILKSLKIAKEENEKVIKLKDYDIRFYYRPDSEKAKKIYSFIKKIGDDHGEKFSFGVLKDQDFFIKKSENVSISIFFLNNEPVGFFYNYLHLSEDKHYICHQGTFILNKNIGVDILNVMGLLNNVFIFQKIGEFYLTTISRVPSVIEVAFENTENSWPHPELSCQYPPSRTYKKIFQESMNSFKDMFLEDDEEISIDDKKFIVKITKTSHQFEKSIKKYKLAKNFKYNDFLNFWINYNENEMLFLVSQYNSKVQKNNKKKLIKSLIYYNLK